MANVNSRKLDDIITMCSSGEIRVPIFQREIVWSPPQVARLAESILSGLPCGALTTWKDPGVPSDEIGLRENNKTISFQAKQANPKVSSVVIDGLQRLTAVCLVFGGLRNNTGKWRFGGRFFIDMDKPGIQESVRLVKDSEIKQKNLEDMQSWIHYGLFPLTTKNIAKISEQTPMKGEFITHWVTMNNIIRSDNNLRRRKKSNDILVAVSSNDIFAEIEIDNLSLGEIADLFEVLNTAGTKVSAVDIVHANLVDFYKKTKPNFQLREWIDDICADSKSTGWGQSKRRELIAQLVVATDLALDKRYPAIKAGGKQPTSVKNTDMLSLNHKHWDDVIKNVDDLKSAIYDFQIAVLGYQFPQQDCPYPISSGIYVGLWWHHKFEKAKWKKDRLDSIFRAFFWSNVLSQRYDQGFLTQMATDLHEIKEFLQETEKTSDKQWLPAAKKFLDKIFNNPSNPNLIVKRQRIIDLLTTKKPRGAMGAGLKLPVQYRVTSDIIDPTQRVDFPQVTDIQLHHIFPKKWINDNFNRKKFGTWYDGKDNQNIKDAVNSLANLTPLTGDSNKKWSSKSPGTMIPTLNKTEQSHSSKVWNERFIDANAFNDLTNDKPKDFMETRSEQIADWILQQTKIK